MLSLEHFLTPLNSPQLSSTLLNTHQHLLKLLYFYHLSFSFSGTYSHFIIINVNNDRYIVFIYYICNR